MLGARTSQSAAPDLYAALRDAYDAHRARRDDLIGQIARRGRDTGRRATAYEVPGRTGDRGRGHDARGARAGARLRRRCTPRAVANTSAERRAWAVEALNDAAVRELGFRGTPEMFPGADEYADR